MAVAGEAGKEEEEPHCDVMEALTGCWGVGRANLVVWRDGAGQNCQRVASVEEESDFSVNHLVMFMCTVFSCVVGRGCLL